MDQLLGSPRPHGECFKLEAQFKWTAQSLRGGGLSMAKSLGLLAHCILSSSSGVLVVTSLYGPLSLRSWGASTAARPPPQHPRDLPTISLLLTEGK